MRKLTENYAKPLGVLLNLKPIRRTREKKKKKQKPAVKKQQIGGSPEGVKTSSQAAYLKP